MSDDVLTRLEALAPGIPAEIERLEQQRAQIDAQIKRLRRLHAALTDEPAQAKPKQRERSTRGRRASSRGGRPEGIGEERLLAIAEAMLSFDVPFTVGDLAERTGFSDGTLHRATNYMRELEFVGKAGVRPHPTGRGNGAATFRVLDAHVIDTLRAKVRSEGNGVPA